MRFYNGSTSEICVGPTLNGPPAHKGMMLRPGQTLDIPEILPNLRILFATTPDGLRVAVHEEIGLYLPANVHLN